jgi:DeoR family fructose operon transcriptional repressor
LIIVTNGLNHINTIIENNINGYILGGKVKNSTKAVIGCDALKSLEKFRSGFYSYRL